MEFDPVETWLLEERLEILLEAVRYETDHVEISRSGNEALLASTQASGTYAHIAVLHHRDAVGEASTTGDAEGDRGLVRASYQHEDSPRTDRVQRALEPFRRTSLDHASGRRR